MLVVRWTAVAVVYFATAAALLAGGSGLNVVVVVNASSTNPLHLPN